MFAAAEAGEFDLLVVHELSRLARDQELGQHVEALDIRIVSATDQTDYSTPEGRGMYDLHMSLSAHWSRKMAQHIGKSKAEQFERGLPAGSLPFGYTRAMAKDVPEIVPSEAAALRKAFTDRANGKGYSAIGEDLDAAGMRPRSRQGYTRFTVSSVQSLSENPFYAGFVTHKGERHRGVHEAIVSQEEFAAAQNVRRHQPRHGSSPAALLAGIARCAACEGPIWTSTTGAKAHRVTSYREPAHKQFRHCPNARTMWNAAEPDRQVDAVFRVMGIDDEWITKRKREAQSDRPSMPARRKELEAKRGRATDAYIEGGISALEWRTRTAAIERQLRDLPRERPAPAIASLETIRSWGQLWDKMLLSERRQVIAMATEEVAIDTRGKSLFLKPRAEFVEVFAHRRAALADRILVELPPAGIEPAHMV